jgi:folylpolyglutamate synthase/dihydropteroate synthase
MDWLEDASKGIKSYSALYDRIKSETQVQTSESIVIEMGYLEQKDVKEVVEKFVSLYEESYSTNIGSEKLKQIQKHAVSKFSDSQGDISIAPRRIIKWLVEVLDKLKDSPGSIDDVLEQVPVALATGEDSGANYDDLFDGEEEDE